MSKKKIEVREEEGLQVRILAPTKRIYEGPAVSISANNLVGPFDVLAGHANFFTLLTASAVVLDLGTQKLTIDINQGLMKVKNNVVTLFADIDPNHLA